MKDKDELKKEGGFVQIIILVAVVILVFMMVRFCSTSWT
jgi:hypothetical protein